MIPTINKQLMERHFGKQIPSTGASKVTLSLDGLSKLLDTARAEGVDRGKAATKPKESTPADEMKDLFNMFRGRK